MTHFTFEFEVLGGATLERWWLASWHREGPMPNRIHLAEPAPGVVQVQIFEFAGKGFVVNAIWCPYEKFCMGLSGSPTDGYYQPTFAKAQAEAIRRFRKGLPPCYEHGMQEAFRGLPFRFEAQDDG